MSPDGFPLVGAAILLACAFLAPLAAAYGLGRYEQKRKDDAERRADLQIQSRLIHNQYASQNRSFVRMGHELARLRALCLSEGIIEEQP